MVGRWGRKAAVALLTLGSAGSLSAQQPRLTADQAVALFAAAGFPLGADKHPLNRCGQPADPKISFIDMNADGRPEALFIDEGSCYQRDGRWYAVVAQRADGQWRRVLDGEGSVTATGTSFNGWFVLAATHGGATTRLHYDGTVYAPTAGGGPAAAVTTRHGGAYPTDGWKPPFRFATLPAGAQAAIMQAAGLTLRDGVWKGCDGDSEVAPDGVEIKDINGDGRPEAIVSDASSGCYGMAGQQFTVLVAQSGGWKAVMQEVGIPILLAHRGPGNYPDIQIGGPGTCWGVDRWNGTAYAFIGSFYDPGGPDAGKPCKP
jgi:hypothetical protein